MIYYTNINSNNNNNKLTVLNKQNILHIITTNKCSV